MDNLWKVVFRYTKGHKIDMECDFIVEADSAASAIDICSNRFGDVYDNSIDLSVDIYEITCKHFDRENPISMINFATNK